MKKIASRIVDFLDFLDTHHYGWLAVITFIGIFVGASVIVVLGVGIIVLIASFPIILVPICLGILYLIWHNFKKILKEYKEWH